MNSAALYLIPALPLLGFVINGVLALWGACAQRKPPEIISSFFGCLLPILSFAIALQFFFTLLAGPEGGVIQAQPLFTWLDTPLLQADFSLMMDSLSSVMTLVVTGVGSLIHIYSTGYMKKDPGYARYFSYLNLFLFFMLLLVLSDNLLLLFVGWEGVGLCSYLLVGYWFTDADKAYAGKKAFVVNRIGDFGFLIGIFTIIYAFASQSQSSDHSLLSYTFMKSHAVVLAPFALAITLCLFAGATGKSAQIPLYVWLPDAMAGPTPVSALIHAATMVTAGIYMVARLYFLFTMAPLSLEIIACIGLSTALLAALIAVTQYDIKKVLAYSTVSQLGFMFVALGVGAPSAAIFHLVTHAFFKACLFMGAGSIIHALHHEQDIRHMGGLRKKLPLTFFAFLMSTLAIAGIPPFSGFFSKDEILWNVFQHAPLPFYILTLATAGITAFYMFRLFYYVFLGRERFHHPPEYLPVMMNGSVLILAVLAIVGGIMGIPQVLGGHHWIHHWLHIPSPFEHGVADHHLELMLMGASTVWAAFMGGLSLFLYARNPEWTRNLKIKFKGAYVAASEKFYVDEMYDTLIVTPIERISRVFLWQFADKKLVDGLLVHGWSDMASFFARVASRVQTGVLSHYLLYLWVGLIGLMWVMLGG